MQSALLGIYRAISNSIETVCESKLKGHLFTKFASDGRKIAMSGLIGDPARQGKQVRAQARTVCGHCYALSWTMPGAEVSLKLEIDAEVGSGLDRAEVRTLLENASTPGFIDKAVK